jgi:hypothetical protein
MQSMVEGAVDSVLLPPSGSPGRVRGRRPPPFAGEEPGNSGQGFCLAPYRLTPQALSISARAFAKPASA